MHSSVFEISHAPVPAAKRTRAGNLPDWFYEQICDYTENTDLVQRQDAIRRRWPCITAGTGGVVTGDDG